MKIKDLRKLIRESLNEIALDEMAIATKLKLAPDWEKMWAAEPDRIKYSVQYKRVIKNLKEKGDNTLKQMAMDECGSTDTACVNKQVIYLVQQGIVERGEKEREPLSTSTGRKNPEGIYGRPKVTDEETKMLGLNIIRKFSKGISSFTAAEQDLIAKLYDASQGGTEEMGGENELDDLEL
jgi:hypothetical protein